MDPDRSNKSVDHTDHSYPYKNEVSLSIGDEVPKYNKSSSSASSVAVLTPTPQPRLANKSDSEINVPSSLPEDNVLLTRNTDDQNRNGLDNPGFEAESKQPPRPLSSFGQNGHGDVKTPVSNGNGTEKPLAGIELYC